MESIVRPRTAKPPVGTRIDWSNPLTRGLAICLPFWEGGGTVAFNAVNGKQYTHNADYVAGKLSLGSSDHVDLGEEFKSIADNTSLTVLALTKTSAVDSFIFSSRSGNTDGFEILVGAGATQGIVTARIDGTNGGVQAGTARSYNINKPCLLGAAFARGSTLTGVYTIVDGTIYSEGDKTTGSVVGSQNLYINRRGTTYSTQSLSLFLLYNRILTEAEVKQLNDNPWQIFEPEILWLGDSAKVVRVDVTVTGSATVTASKKLTGLFATENIPFAEEAWQFGGETNYGNATVTGTATLFAVGEKASTTTVEITGSADLATVFRKSVKVIPTVSGTAAVEVTASHAGAATTSVTGTSTVAATGIKRGIVNPSVTGSATVVVVGFPVQADKANIVITGDAAVTVDFYKSIAKTPSVTGTSTSTATGIKSIPVTPSATGTGAVAVVVKGRKVGTAAVEGDGAVSVTYEKTEIVPGVGNPRVQADPLVTVVVKKRSIGLPAVTGTGTVSAAPRVAKAGATLCLGTATVVCVGYRAILPPGVISVVGDAQVTASGIHNAIVNLDIRGDPLVAATGSKGPVTGNAVVTGSAAVSVISYNPAQAVLSIHVELIATPATIEIIATPATVTLTNI